MRDKRKPSHLEGRGRGRWGSTAGGTAWGRTTTTTHTSTGILILNTTLLSVIGCGGDTGVDGRVHTNRDPSEDSIGDVIAQVDVLHEWVNGVELFAENAVLGVEGHLLSVGRVRGNLISGGNKILVEENLSNVRRGRGVQTGKGSVCKDLGLVGWVGEDY